MARPVPLDGVADSVDATGVVLLEEPGSPAERFGEVPVLAGQLLQLKKGLPQSSDIYLIGVCLDEALGQDSRVPRDVDSGDETPATLPLLSHSGGPGEQVDCRLGARSGEQLAENRDQPALRPDVLDDARRVDVVARDLESSPVVLFCFGVSARALRDRLLPEIQIPLIVKSRALAAVRVLDFEQRRDQIRDIRLQEDGS